MAVVIRLQGLRVTAGTQDIRRFFSGLKIPDGGVHIIGGDREEAFIIFASDEDARRAIARSGLCIKDTPVTLLLSSKAEMEDMLERSTQMAEIEQRRQFDENVRPARSFGPDEGRRSGSRSGHSPSDKHPRASNGGDDGTCLFLKGLPYTVTQREVQEFFSGLLIDDLLFLKKRDGSNNGSGFIKFATRQQASEGLKMDRNYIGSRYIEVSRTSAHDWLRTTGRLPVAVNRGNVERDRSPIRNQRNPQNYARSQSPLAQTPIPKVDEYCVLLENLAFDVEKEDIKKLFHHAKLENDQILHLMDSEGRRTRSTFVLFKSQRDYCDALSQEQRMFFNRFVSTRPVSRENMISLLQSHCTDMRPPGNSEQFQERPPSFPSDRFESEKLCVFVRNMPLDVRKVEIMDFFIEFDISEENVFLLLDHEGTGVGKALVLFQSEAEASRAMSLNGQRFLGSEVLLKCISQSQMKQLGVNPPTEQEPFPRQGRYTARGSEAPYHQADKFPDFRMSRDGNTSVNDVQDLQGRDFESYAVDRRRGDYEQYIENHRGRDYEPNTEVRRGRDYEPYAEDHRGRDYEPYGSRAPQDKGNGFHGNFDTSLQPLDGPTCVQLQNLPFHIKVEEIYDFCYGYQIIPGSISLQFDQGGKPLGSATVMFETHREALIAIEELSGRPIGPRKIRLMFF